MVAAVLLRNDISLNPDNLCEANFKEGCETKAENETLKMNYMCSAFR